MIWLADARVGGQRGLRLIRLVEVERHLGDDQTLHDLVVELERLPLALLQVVEQRGATHQRAVLATQGPVVDADARGEDVPRGVVPVPGRPHRQPVLLLEPEGGEEHVQAVAAVVHRAGEEDRGRGGAELVAAQLVRPHERRRDRPCDEHVGDGDDAVGDQPRSSSPCRSPRSRSRVAPHRTHVGPRSAALCYRLVRYRPGNAARSPIALFGAGGADHVRVLPVRRAGTRSTMAAKDMLERLRSPAEVRVVVPAPPAAVFAVLSDPETYPEWLAGAQRIRRVDDDFPDAGSQVRPRGRPQRGRSPWPTTARCGRLTNRTASCSRCTPVPSRAWRSSSSSARVRARSSRSASGSPARWRSRCRWLRGPIFLRNKASLDRLRQRFEPLVVRL